MGAKLSTEDLRHIIDTHLQPTGIHFLFAYKANGSYACCRVEPETWSWLSGIHTAHRTHHTSSPPSLPALDPDEGASRLSASLLNLSAADTGEHRVIVKVIPTQGLDEHEGSRDTGYDGDGYYDDSRENGDPISTAAGSGRRSGVRGEEKGHILRDRSELRRAVLFTASRLYHLPGWDGNDHGNEERRRTEHVNVGGGNEADGMDTRRGDEDSESHTSSEEMGSNDGNGGNKTTRVEDVLSHDGVSVVTDEEEEDEDEIGDENNHQQQRNHGEISNSAIDDSEMSDSDSEKETDSASDSLESNTDQEICQIRCVLTQAPVSSHTHLGPFLPKEPNFPVLLAVWHTPEALVLVYQYCEHSLASVQRYNADLLAKDDVRRRFVIFQLVEAVHRMHQRGMHHGALSPSKVLFNNALWLLLSGFRSLLLPHGHDNSDCNTSNTDNNYDNNNNNNNNNTNTSYHNNNGGHHLPQHRQHRHRHHYHYHPHHHHHHQHRVRHVSLPRPVSVSLSSHIPRRTIGQRPSQQDLAAVVFRQHAEPSHGEMVLVPRSSGGFTYGKVVAASPSVCRVIINTAPPSSSSSSPSVSASASTPASSMSNSFSSSSPSQAPSSPAASSPSPSPFPAFSNVSHTASSYSRNHTASSSTSLSFHPRRRHQRRHRHHQHKGNEPRRVLAWKELPTGSIGRLPRQERQDTAEAVVLRWRARELSNLEYLLALNTLAGRRRGDCQRHPVVPWVIDFTRDPSLCLFEGNISPTSRGEDEYAVPDGVRDLTRSKYRLNKGDAMLDMTYAAAERPHHITECLSEITYYMYLARRTPVATLCRHVRRKYEPKEYPLSLQRMYEWTPDECIPELYEDPSVFYSIHDDMDDLRVPQWASGPVDLVRLHRQALESEWVSRHLHHWIDLVFGYKLSGKAAVEAKNVPLRPSKSEFPASKGFVQLFDTPHPPRTSPDSKSGHSIDDTLSLLRFAARSVFSRPPYQLRSNRKDSPAPAADMFSVGCITAELYLGRPIFATGRAAENHLHSHRPPQDLAAIPQPARALITSLLEPNAHLRPSSEAILNSPLFPDYFHVVHRLLSGLYAMPSDLHAIRYLISQISDLQSLSQPALDLVVPHITPLFPCAVDDLNTSYDSLSLIVRLANTLSRNSSARQALETTITTFFDHCGINTSPSSSHHPSPHILDILVNAVHPDTAQALRLILGTPVFMSRLLPSYLDSLCIPRSDIRRHAAVSLVHTARNTGSVAAVRYIIAGSVHRVPRDGYGAVRGVLVALCRWRPALAVMSMMPMLAESALNTLQNGSGGIGVWRTIHGLHAVLHRWTQRLDKDPHQVETVVDRLPNLLNNLLLYLYRSDPQPPVAVFRRAVQVVCGMIAALHSLGKHHYLLGSLSASASAVFGCSVSLVPPYDSFNPSSEYLQDPYRSACARILFQELRDTPGCDVVVAFEGMEEEDGNDADDDDDEMKYPDSHVSDNKDPSNLDMAYRSVNNDDDHHHKGDPQSAPMGSRRSGSRSHTDQRGQQWQQIEEPHIMETLADPLDRSVSHSDLQRQEEKEQGKEKEEEIHGGDPTGQSNASYPDSRRTSTSTRSDVNDEEFVCVPDSQDGEWAARMLLQQGTPRNTDTSPPVSPPSLGAESLSHPLPLSHHQVHLTLPIHSSPVRSLDCPPDQSCLVASGAKDGTVRIWDVDRCRMMNQIAKVNKDIYQVKFLEKGEKGLWCDGGIHIWDGLTGQVIGTAALRVTALSALSSPMLPNTIITSASDASIRFIDTRTFQQTHEWRLTSSTFAGRSQIRSITLDWDTSHLCVGLSSGVIFILERRSGMILDSFRAHDGPVNALLPHPVHGLLSMGTNDRTAPLAFWNPQQRSHAPDAVVKSEPGTESVLLGVDVSPDDDKRGHIVAATGNGLQWGRIPREGIGGMEHMSLHETTASSSSNNKNTRLASVVRILPSLGGVAVAGDDGILRLCS